MRDAPPQFTIDGSQLNSGNGLLFSGTAASNSVVSALGIVNFPSDGVVMALGANNISINRSYIGIRPINGAMAGNGAYGINAVATNSHNIGKTRHSNNNQFVSLGNVISANGSSGIKLFNSSNNTINANLIGLAETGTGDRGNGQYGIEMSGNNNQVGDYINNSLAGNYLAANNSGGITSDGDNNRFYTNQLGLGESGLFISSESNGIEVSGELNFIGNNGNAKNKIYEHAGAGIVLGVEASTSGNNNFVVNNDIGSAGNISALSRSGNGIGIQVANGNTNLIQDNLVLNSGIDTGIGYGISVIGNDTTISGNQVGFVDGLFDVDSEPNKATGIRVIGDGNVIGTNANPNYVGGNDFRGIYVEGDDIRIEYNRIGVNVDYEKIGNGGIGLQVLHNSGDLVLQDNVIGDNSSGMLLEYPSNTPNIRFNHIGISPDGKNIGNEFWGIKVFAGVLSDVSYNHISHNGDDGISIDNFNVIDPSAGMAIFQNTMFDNGDLGIDLNDDGFSPNDVGDVDEGNNRTQNHPEITSLVFDDQVVPPTVSVTYRVDSISPSEAEYPLFIDFYWTHVDEVSQGRLFLGTEFNYTTPNQLLIKTFDLPVGTTGGIATATALDQARNSSEFAPGVQFGIIDLIFEDGFE